MIPRYDFPNAPIGATVGLFGGSFDPAHDGHVHVTRHALRRLQLDQMWWLVSPGNPLKPHGPAPMDARLAHARALMQHPKLAITGLEAQIGTRFTADTLAVLRQALPRRRFVWVMGADNMANFHHWEKWRWIMQTTPIAVIARPGQARRALASVAARSFGHARLAPKMAGKLAFQPAPCWCFLQIPMRDISSSRLRSQGRGLG